MPVAIAQYPQFFNENQWILPTSVLAVLFCWIVPLLLHERTRRIYSAIPSIPKVGLMFFVAICLVVAIGSFLGGRKLLRFHHNHLLASLPPAVASKPNTDLNFNASVATAPAIRGPVEKRKPAVPIEAPPDGANVTIVSGPSLSRVHPDETQFIITNQNPDSISGAYSTCQFYDSAGRNEPVGNVVPNTVGELSSGDSFTISCEIPIADTLIKPMTLPSNDVWTFYQYKGKPMQKSVRFIAKRNEDGDYIWLPHGHAENPFSPK
jgi:hypothetical protein